MSYTLGAKSVLELQGVHPDLIRVVHRSIAFTKQDFSVHDGLRTEAEQREYVRRGVSKTMNSMHRKQSDGFGHAVDLVPWIGGKMRWEWPPIFHIASAVWQAAQAALELTAAESRKEFESVRLDIKDLQKVIADGLMALKSALEGGVSEAAGGEKLRARDIKFIGAGAGLVAIITFAIFIIQGASQ